MVYIIDTSEGLQDVMTFEELHINFTVDELEEFYTNKETSFYETKYTKKQLYKCRDLKQDEDFMWDFEEEHGYCPSVIDLLKYYYK